MCNGHWPMWLNDLYLLWGHFDGQLLECGNLIHEVDKIWASGFWPSSSVWMILTKYSPSARVKSLFNWITLSVWYHEIYDSKMSCSASFFGRTLPFSPTSQSVYIGDILYIVYAEREREKVCVYVYGICLSLRRTSARH